MLGDHVGLGEFGIAPRHVEGGVAEELLQAERVPAVPQEHYGASGAEGVGARRRDVVYAAARSASRS